MNRYQHMFARLEKKKQGAFVPFVTLCDPSFETSFTIIEQLILSGADALELGFPYSDPIADGPVIQASSIRALNAGATVDHCFQIISNIRAKYPRIPIGLLLYSNLILARGKDYFYDRAATVGIDSLLIADVPFKESQPFYETALQYNIDPIFIVPPNVTEETMKNIAQYSHGYTYLLSRAGVTGTETVAQMPTQKMIECLRSYGTAPPLLGFGISAPDHVVSALDAGAAGVISGSAVVARIADNLHNIDQLKTAIGDFVIKMKAATYQQ